MKVTYNWLKEFVDIRLSPRALAEKLTMAGIEVTSLEEKQGDSVLEIEVTSNRPDWLSVVGIAREAAAITNRKLKVVDSPQTIVHSKKSNKKNCGLSTMDYGLDIKIANKKDCPLYTAKIIHGVRVGPSPAWLKERLELIGCRSLNNIVDISNYILFERGEPLHAFDLDKLSLPLEIVVRRAKEGESIVTIDGIKRDLHEQVLIIASSDKPIAIAGIMGGRDSEVTSQTKNILLEAAVFDPLLTRRSRRLLGMQSESAYRFERGVDAQTAQGASWQAVNMIEKLAAGKLILAKSAGLVKPAKKIIALDCAYVCAILGAYIPAVKIKAILKGLGFMLTAAKKTLKVNVPAYRQDVNAGIDLVEEIARVYGYASIPSTLPSLQPQPAIPGSRELVALIKNILVGLGLNEVITYSLVSKGLLADFREEDSSLAPEILNPLSREQEVLRPCLTPSLASCVARNFNQQQDYVPVFELASVFKSTLGGPKEELALGLALAGTKSFLLEQGAVKEEAGLLHLKGIIETLCARIGIRELSFVTENPYAVSVYIGKEKAGVMSRLKKDILSRLDIKNKEVVCAELFLEKFFHYVDLAKKFTPAPRYPAITRAISLFLKEEAGVGQILQAALETGRPLLCEVKVIDYYRGKQTPAGFRGLTLSCLYRAQERTLTEAEVAPVHNLICGILTEKFGAQIR